MICDKCENKVVTNTLVISKCKLCDNKMLTSYSPPHIICKVCSLKYDICRDCGESI